MMKSKNNFAYGYNSYILLYISLEQTFIMNIIRTVVSGPARGFVWYQIQVQA